MAWGRARDRARLDNCSRSSSLRIRTVLGRPIAIPQVKAIKCLCQLFMGHNTRSACILRAEPMQFVAIQSEITGESYLASESGRPVFVSSTGIDFLLNGDPVTM